VRGGRERAGKEERKAMQERLNIAVFVDYDNIEIGVKSTLRREFDVSLALDALKERGDIVAKFAYANWGRCEPATRSMAENAVQMVQRIPSPRGDKNGADINLALDALEMAFTHSNITAFAIVSGDSDFIPLVNKLKAYGKTVFVVGGKAFTSTILQQNCHEFVSYESLLDDEVPQRRSGRGPQPQQQQQQQPSQRPPRQKPAPLDLAQAMPLVERALQVLERRSVQPQLGLLKSTMLQLDSRFSEKAFGAGSFSDFVEKMRNAGYIELSGGEGRYLIRRKPSAQSEPPVTDPSEALPVLRDVLETNRIEMDSGVLADDLAAWVRDVNPQFEPTHYGFQEFAELLNFAQDKLLVRIEPDEEKGLLVHLGAEFYPPALPEEPAEPVDEVPVDEPQPIVEGQPTAIPVDEPPKPRKKPTRRKAGTKAEGAAAAKRAPRPRRKKAPAHIGPMV
jgi:uncharacterized protein (TIGR00288 family)